MSTPAIPSPHNTGARRKEVITQSPMSVTGFTKRYLRITRATGGVAIALVFVPRWIFYILFLLVVVGWNLIAWVFFFWFTLAWRAFRNSARREKRRQVEHEEMLAALREGR